MKRIKIILKNNKGLTLVELLAVLVVLATILTIAIPSIASSVERNKQKQLEHKKELIVSDTENYVKLNKNVFAEGQLDKFNTGQCCISINYLKDKDVLTDSETKDSDNNPIYGFVCVINNNYTFSDVLKTECIFN